ncbi:serine/threonine-protein kinase [Umezawaea tangerina]|uniref:serine/threonine-protein kinase n=1 Tax=Umezawaea tangerina TaxID=84725 RepID=UPI001FE4742C|nr:serine/threonine-protein kinase [Umezawaea tangerina]
MPLPVNDEPLAGRYRLGEVIGVGGVATVYRAWDTRLHRQVAIKLCAAHGDLANARRFDNEVRTLAGLHHPGLVSVHDAGTSPDGRPFVVLRLVEGRTLRDRMADGPLPVDEVRSVGAAVADALSYVHARGVVHRDVKPSNILLDEDGVPYLADFGLAHSVGSTRLTRTGLLVGTAAYIAPEQVRGADVDSPADVYALGLVLLECLTGRFEYTGSDVEAIVARLHRAPVIPDDLPADLARLLALMTEQSPGDRPGARQCAEALRTGQPTAVTAVPLPRPRRRVLVAAAGLLGAVGIGWAVAPGPVAPVSEPPGAARPAVVQSSAPVTSTTPETPVQLVAISTAPPVTEQQAPDVVEPAAVPQQEPEHDQVKGSLPGAGPRPGMRPGPAPGVKPGPGEQRGPGKDRTPAHPGGARKGKP